MEHLKKTALFNVHQKYGGKIIDFAGWSLPVQYEGILQEHEAVRKTAGLFDVSHMGEIEVKGIQAEEFMQYLVTNDVSTIGIGQIIYALMCYPHGGVVDDVLIYKFSREYFYIVVNASNIEKDYVWITENAAGYHVQIINRSADISELALQGPKSEEILQKLTAQDLSQLKFFNFMDDVHINGVKCLISRSGYTGEDGFEIYADNKYIEKVWEDLMEVGKVLGLVPAGLGCRDTLRFEACLPLYGNEISENITPLEAGLNIFVKLNKDNFIGKAPLLKQKEEGLKRKLIGFEMLDRGIARHGYEVSVEGKNIGIVTTGYMAPSLKKNIGLALVDSNFSEIDTEINIVIRNKPVKARVINKKFYNKNYKK
ncbi:glycine cleavage system aminomethyltransferase GcvT [Clostridium thermarum]|uniref:glycine cleavage system aminomethyltransferase GcvT n=1 Tax=Clostridium thermarum TaxID=1716543 RepID=UPI00112317D5|nr:glycine cleavage system aminomethyltransferase GcvT [Clostridium thermarum]